MSGPKSALPSNDYALLREQVQPRMRVIVDNDFSGDPDDLFQMAHHLLSPSVDIRAIIGSHLRPGDPFDPSPTTAQNAVNRVKELLAVMGMSDTLPVYEGSNNGLVDEKTPQPSAAASAIIAEAMREDTQLPLFVVCGAGLTDLASAWLLEPRIAEHLTLVWIGGEEYQEMALPPPGSAGTEYNLRIDITAGRVVFNDSQIPIWQVPRNTYRQSLMSYSELLTRVRPCGPLGEFLYQSIERVMSMAEKLNFNMGETYVMGDSPLVLLTALQSPFEADPASSDYVIRDAPAIKTDGSYGGGRGSRPIRIYTRLDTRLLFEDFFHKIAMFAAA